MFSVMLLGDAFFGVMTFVLSTLLLIDPKLEEPSIDSQCPVTRLYGQVQVYRKTLWHFSCPTAARWTAINFRIVPRVTASFKLYARHSRLPNHRTIPPPTPCDYDS